MWAKEPLCCFLARLHRVAFSASAALRANVIAIAGWGDNYFLSAGVRSNTEPVGDRETHAEKCLQKTIST
jgi:hypothetical protein